MSPPARMRPKRMRTKRLPKRRLAAAASATEASWCSWPRPPSDRGPVDADAPQHGASRRQRTAAALSAAVGVVVTEPQRQLQGRTNAHAHHGPIPRASIQRSGKTEAQAARPKAGIKRPVCLDLLSWPAQDPDVPCWTPPWRVLAGPIAAVLSLLGSRISFAMPFIIPIDIVSRP